MLLSPIFVYSSIPASSSQMDTGLSLTNIATTLPPKHETINKKKNEPTRKTKKSNYIFLIIPI